MNIEIHQPELEALIHQRMASGRFQDIEDLLKRSLEAAPDAGEQPSGKHAKQNLAQFLRESPLWQSEISVERQKDAPCPVEL